MSDIESIQTAKPVTSRVKAQLSMLTAQFLLGMAVNLIGLPSEVSGGTRVADIVFVAAHVLIGVGLLINAFIIVTRSSKLNELIMRKAWYGGGITILTFIFGVLTMSLKSNWWSYAMAVGFMALYIVYGEMFLQTTHWRVKE